MCTKDRIQGIRRYIRLLKGTDATLKDELPPRPHTSASAGELPQLVRHGPKSRNPPLGAEDSRDVSAVYAAMAAKRKKIPQAPKCLLPIPGTGEEKEGSSEGITLDLRGMNLTDDEARLMHSVLLGDTRRTSQKGWKWMTAHSSWRISWRFGEKHKV
eukprot:g24651.t1